MTAKQLRYLTLDRTWFRNEQPWIWAAVLSTIKSFGVRQGNRSFFAKTMIYLTLKVSLTNLNSQIRQLTKHIMRS